MKLTHEDIDALFDDDYFKNALLRHLQNNLSLKVECDSSNAFETIGLTVRVELVHRQTFGRWRDVEICSSSDSA